MWKKADICSYEINTRLVGNPLSHPLKIDSFKVAILFRPFGFIVSETLNYVSFQSLDIDLTWLRLFQKRIACTKSDIYIFIFY
jgi:hypothetical protein